ncbi:hypothetical protein Tco_0452866 [Tanacetum coccineum]
MEVAESFHAMADLSGLLMNLITDPSAVFSVFTSIFGNLWRQLDFYLAICRLFEIDDWSGTGSPSFFHNWDMWHDDLLLAPLNPARALEIINLPKNHHGISNSHRGRQLDFSDALVWLVRLGRLGSSSYRCRLGFLFTFNRLVVAEGHSIWDTTAGRGFWNLRLRSSGFGLGLIRGGFALREEA